MRKTTRWIVLLLCFTFALSPMVGAVELNRASQDDTSALTQSDEIVLPAEGENLESEQQAPESPAEDSSTDPPSVEKLPEPQTVTVTFQDGEKVLLKATVEAGQIPSEVPTMDIEGNPILGWVCDGKKVSDPTQVAVTGDTVYTVWTAPDLNTVDHIVYINGQEENKFEPDSPLTRDAAAKMISTLLLDPTPGELAANFSDVSVGAWYEEPVTLLASLGILNGYEDGTFCPEQTISRAEFVYLLTNFFPLEPGENTFYDVPDTYWAKDAIASATAEGWINGDEDGSFRPDEPILRCEAVKVLNAVLGRSAAAHETKNLIRENNICIFTDVKATAWYYADVMEASIPHEYAQDDSGEVWSNFTYQSCGYDPGLQKIGNAYYIVDGNRQITFQTPGMQTINGKLYYVATDGSIPVYPAGLKEIGTDLYCVNEDGSLLTDGSVEYLTFGPDGRYTSGDAYLDSLVKSALASCTNARMTRSEKLRASYLYLRENFRYLSRAHHARGSTDWYQESATFMFTHRRGNCYCFSAAFMYMARQLGYQAYGVSGGYSWSNGDHAWVMIGNRLFDPELEYAYRYRVSVKRYYNLYDIDPANAPIIYHFPRSGQSRDISMSQFQLADAMDVMIPWEL